ncbi:MAG: hypothetical protein LBS53_12365 [Synergistaceae bacterium]|nr:hypothetical protein [Synergistaceae bacterium]
MRRLLILSLIIAIVIFLTRFILAAVIFFIAVMTLVTLLASFGLLPGVVTRRRRWIKSDAARADRRTRKTHYHYKEERVWEENDGGHDFHDDGEVIILPETALRKDEHAKSRRSGPSSERGGSSPS